MPRSVSSVTETNINKAVTEPYYLVYIGYGTPLRKSSRETVTWNSETWIAEDMIVTVNPDRNEATLKIQNTDYVFGGVVLATTIADVPVKIYEVHGDSLAVADAELLFDGVGSGADLDMRWVVVDLVKASTGKMFSPRVMCSKEIGFNHLPPDNLTISWGGEQYILETKG